MIRGIIFDHDGTLVNSERQHYLLWASILDKYHIDFSEEEYKNHLAGVPTRANAGYLTERYPLLPLSAEELFVRREKLTREAFHQKACPLIEGARELVEWVSARGLKMAIATGASSIEVGGTLSEHGFARYFPVVATREDVQHPKPAPDVYLHALEKMGLEAQDCIAIEDSPTGLQSALAAGVACIVVQNDYSRGHDFTDAHCVLDSMGEAQSWLEREYF